MIDDMTLYGAPTVASNDATGAAVNPMFSSAQGGTDFGNANPFSEMAFEDGGAIPDSDPLGEPDNDADDATAGEDLTTQAFSHALQAVNAGLLYGRQKHGLPTDDEGDGGGDIAEGGEFEEGGAVPDDDMDYQTEYPQRVSNEAYTPSAPSTDDNSGAAPSVGAIPDDSGAAPVVSAQDDTGGQRKAAQTVLSYLMGADGVAPEVVDGYKQGARGTEADRNLFAIERAYQDQGEKGAWGVLQALRRKYDLFMNHGRAAAEQGDFPAAAQSATQAMNNLPDGNNITFAPAQGGLVARLGQQSVPLSRQAASEFMNTGKTGQFDTLIEVGAPKVLQQLAGAAVTDNDGTQSQPADMQVQTQAPVTSGRGRTPLNPADPDTDREVTMGHDMTLLRASPQYRDNFPENYRRGATQPERLGSARILTPPGSGWRRGADHADARNASMMDRERLKQAGLDRREKMRTERMSARDASRTDLEQRKALAAATKMEQQSNDARLRERGRMARAAISNPNFLLQTDEQRANIYKQFGIDKLMQEGDSSAPKPEQPRQSSPAAPPAPKPTAPQPSSNASPVQRPGNVPEGARLYKGKWYTRGPNGEAVPVE